MTDTLTGQTVDPAEVARFSRMSKEWWNPRGKFKPLHKFNPVRLRYVKDVVCARFGRDPKSPKPFEGLRFLDIGCGGGLLSEPMARLGAEVVGVDPSAMNIGVARLHAEESGLDIDYRQGIAEDLAGANERFDVILNMEVVEHVADVPLYLQTCAGMVKPGGLMVVATINRTPKAMMLAIVGAEYVLRWLPKGTHQYEKLVRPDEIRGPLESAGMAIEETTGVFYNPLADEWRLSSDTDVNYMMLATRSA
jgi:2-polyprenyl-6-hydroxyphenyl methylase / 3-demethylubiquinone-9 3-methyltransferase